MQQQPPISLQLLSQLKVKYFCSNLRHPGVKHLCLSWPQLQLPLQLTRGNGNFYKVVQLILRQMSLMDQKMLSEGAFLSPLKEFLWPSPPRYGQLQLHWIHCCCWCTVLHCCDRSRMGLVTICLHRWDIWEEKYIRCLGLLVAIGGWQGSCCTQWIWFIHHLFCKFSFCEEFCSLGEFLLCTGGRDTAVLSRGHICASFFSKRLQQIWGKIVVVLVPKSGCGVWLLNDVQNLWGCQSWHWGWAQPRVQIQVKSGASSPGR